MKGRSLVVGGGGGGVVVVVVVGIKNHEVRAKSHAH